MIWVTQRKISSPVPSPPTHLDCNLFFCFPVELFHAVRKRWVLTPAIKWQMRGQTICWWLEEAPLQEVVVLEKEKPTVGARGPSSAVPKAWGAHPPSGHRCGGSRGMSVALIQISRRLQVVLVALNFHAAAFLPH